MDTVLLIKRINIHRVLIQNASSNSWAVPCTYSESLKLMSGFSFDSFAVLLWRVILQFLQCLVIHVKLLFPVFFMCFVFLVNFVTQSKVTLCSRSSLHWWFWWCLDPHNFIVTLRCTATRSTIPICRYRFTFLVSFSSIQYVVLVVSTLWACTILYSPNSWFPFLATSSAFPYRRLCWILVCNCVISDLLVPYLWHAVATARQCVSLESPPHRFV